MSEIEFETELTFNKVEYLISVSSYKVSTFDSEMRLLIDVEDKWGGNIWRGDFKQAYAEEITAKAGKPKKFNVFTKMLLSALNREEP
jgi:hypothetical protein